MSLRERILDKVDDLEIFYHYLESRVPLGKAIRSPLRKDRHPSFNIYRSESNSRIYYNDFAGDRGDCFKFVMEVFDCDFRAAIEKVANDFGVSIQGPVRDLSKLQKKVVVNVPKIIIRERVKFEYLARSFSEQDLKYWGTFGITEEVLNEYLVEPLNWFKVIGADVTFNHEDNCPIYMLNFGGEPLKFYRPFSKTRKDKYKSNLRRGDIYGLHPITEKQSVLVVCAGGKDCLSLYSNTGIRGVALNSESANLSSDIYIKLMNYADQLAICYDNDKTGIENALKIHAKTGIPVIDLRKITQVNDISNYFEDGGDPETLKNLING